MRPRATTARTRRTPNLLDIESLSSGSSGTSLHRSFPVARVSRVDLDSNNAIVLYQKIGSTSPPLFLQHAAACCCGQTPFPWLVTKTNLALGSAASELQPFLPAMPCLV